MMRKLIIFGLVLLVVPTALCAEPVGCDKFAWPVDTERALLGAPDKVAAGTEPIAPEEQKAILLKLAPIGEAHLPMTPERAPKPGADFAGYVRFAAAKAGIHKITLAAPAWIDVVQNGKFVPSTAFTGAEGCAGIRKSVKFDLAAAPFTIQISGASSNAIALVVTPAN